MYAVLAADVGPLFEGKGDQRKSEGLYYGRIL